MAKTNLKPHAIIFPLPYQGHINPIVNLAMKLASNGLKITFVHTQYVHHTLTKVSGEADIFSEAKKSGLDIHCTTISDGFPLDFDRLLHAGELLESLLHDFPARVDEFIGNTIRSSEPSLVSFLIADSFFTWAATIANKYNLVLVSFFTQPALVCTIGYHWDLLTQNGHFPCKDNVEEEIDYIPGVESLSTKDLMSFFSEAEISTPVQKSSFVAYQEMKKADFMLHCTVHELESNTLEVLSKYQPTYAIGPTCSFTYQSKTSVNKSLRPESNCTEWLNSMPSGSVLYISFGSAVQTSKQVIEEIAYGLLLSGVNFLWVVRENIAESDDTDVFPAGFEDEIVGKGLIVPWCDQIMVLSNPAVGGFLTHCGWNSTFESMWCGIPMICYPVKFDQPTNRKLVVDYLKIGINLYDGTTIHREEISEKIRNFMSEIASLGLRQEAKKVKTILHNSLETNGSSQVKFDQFIKDLKAKIYAKKIDKDPSCPAILSSEV